MMRYGYESQWFERDAIRQKVSTVAVRLLAALKRQREVRLSCHHAGLQLNEHCLGGPVSTSDGLSLTALVDWWSSRYDTERSTPSTGFFLTVNATQRYWEDGRRPFIRAWTSNLAQIICLSDSPTSVLSVWKLQEARCR